MASRSTLAPPVPGARQKMTEEEFWALQGPFSSKVFKSNDAQEGPKAFAEKRTPEWTGT